MITGTLFLFALILGYIVTVGLSMMLTFGIAQAAPTFVVKDHLLKTGYRIFQEMVWLLCVTVGGYVSASVAQSTMHPWFVCVILAGILAGTPWTNTWEVAQRGLGHQIVMSVASVAGVVAGYILRLR